MLTMMSGERLVYAAASRLPRAFVMTISFPFTVILRFESSSRITADPISVRFFGRPEGFPEVPFLNLPLFRRFTVADFIVLCLFIIAHVFIHLSSLELMYSDLPCVPL